MKKRVSLIVAVLFVMTAIFTACGTNESKETAVNNGTVNSADSEKSASPAETKKIKVVSQMFYDPLQQQYVKETVLPKFKEETGIDVELQVVASGTELYKVLDAQKSTGNWTADVLITHDSFAVGTVKQYGALEAYDWQPEGTFITQFDDNFVVEGKRYYIPLEADVYVMIVNKKALPYLEELGFDVNKLTWEQLAAWCNNIKEKTGKPRYVFPALAGKFAAYQFNAIQLAYGAKYVPVFNTPEAKNAFDIISSMKDAILPSSPTIDFPTVPLASEDAWISVFHQGYAYTSYNQAPDKFVVAPVPMGEDGYRGTIQGGHGIGIVAGSPNKDASKKFIDFILRDDILYNVMSKTGPWVPAKQEVASKLGSDPADVIMKIGLESLSGDTRTDRVRSSEYQDFNLVKKLYETAFADILAGKNLDQAYLDAKQAELEKIKN
ncbi:MAG: sugar ABC transporter substrate-binding protein [Ruminiclostridium sp.]